MIALVPDGTGTLGEIAALEQGLLRDIARQGLRDRSRPAAKRRAAPPAPFSGCWFVPDLPALAVH